MPAKRSKDLAANRKQARLDYLYYAAKRVANNFGCDEDGVASDWSEWVDLQKALKSSYDAGDISR